MISCYLKTYKRADAYKTGFAGMYRGRTGSAASIAGAGMGP